MLQVTAPDLVETSTGYHIRVRSEHTKSDTYREPPVSEQVYHKGEVRGETIAADEPLVDRDAKTIYRWTKRAADRCRAESDEEGWQFVTPHDLRRTWGTQLLEAGVLPSVVMAWGGWEDWETFRDHYLGEFSPESIRRERNKVEYLAQSRSPEPEQSAGGYSAFESGGRTR
jgi:integrase